MPKSRYNIAHILPWPSIGGTEISTLRIAQALEGKRFNNVIFCLAKATPVEEMFSTAGFQTVSYNAVEPSYRHPKEFLQTAWQLAREFKRQRIDLVHCEELLAAHYTAIAGKIARLPVLCHVRNPYDEISRRDQSFLRAVDKFVFVSRDSWNHFGYKIAPRRGTIIYDGIEVSELESPAVKQDVRREFGISGDDKIIGMVARVAPQKDYATLARAAARVVAIHPNVRFLIIGDHSQAESNRQHYEEVKRILAENNVAPYFIFTGFRRDVKRLIAALDIFVLSTHAEGFGLVVIEALAQCKPAVVTGVGGVLEIIRDGETGLLYAHQDDEHFAAHINTLLENEEFGAKLGIAGREFVKANFGAEQFAHNMHNIYNELLRLKVETMEARMASEVI